MLRKRLLGSGRVMSTVALAATVLLATWMGFESGGYFAGEWTLVAFVLSSLMLVLSVTVGVSGGATRSWYGVAAIALFALYASWTLASLLWSPNRGDAWVGGGQTLVYLISFWVALGLFGLGASRRWVLAASAIGPAVVAAFTLWSLVPRVEELFDNNRLIGTVGYFNGEAAFLLVPFWISVYLAGSRFVHPILRGLVLAGATLCVEVAVLTQSRGAMVAMILSLPVFFLVSGQRLRGFIALAPVVVAVLFAFPELNDVYLTLLNPGSPEAPLERAISAVWPTVAATGVYGLVWGFVDWVWRPPALVAQVAGGIALAASMVVLAVGLSMATDRVGNLAVWGEQKWEAFKNDDRTGQEQSRYLSASGSGRYTL
ncbi:MAG: O-antigen ligase family protein, partial [Rubrobacter sp.]